MGQWGSPYGALAGHAKAALHQAYRSNEQVQRAWWTGYDEAKDTALADTLDSPELLERFRSGGSLPRGFGFTLDERIVEIPWVVANLSSPGAVLDAGWR